MGIVCPYFDLAVSLRSGYLRKAPKSLRAENMTATNPAKDKQARQPEGKMQHTHGIRRRRCKLPSTSRPAGLTARAGLLDARREARRRLQQCEQHQLHFGAGGNTFKSLCCIRNPVLPHEPGVSTLHATVSVFPRGNPTPIPDQACGGDDDVENRPWSGDTRRRTVAR